MSHLNHKYENPNGTHSEGYYEGIIDFTVGKYKLVFMDEYGKQKYHRTLTNQTPEPNYLDGYYEAGQDMLRKSPNPSKSKEIEERIAFTYESEKNIDLYG
jgi:hypothetical protein